MQVVVALVEVLTEPLEVLEAQEVGALELITAQQLLELQTQAVAAVGQIHQKTVVQAAPALLS